MSFWVLSPLLLPIYANAVIRSFNFHLIRWQVRRAMRRVSIHRPHVIVTIPTAIDIAAGLDGSTLTYNRADNHSAFHEANTPLIQSLEHRLLTEANVVLYSSRSFMQSEATKTDSRALFVDHGVDLDLFGAIRRPTGALTELGVHRPIVGFFGGIDDYVIDMVLLERVAVALPQATIVLIGDATLSLNTLLRHPNVRHLGFRPYAEIPRLGGDFDVAIMPWKNNEWIRCCNPIKLKEYLALGLEVVSTWFPEVEHYRDYLHIARTPEAFVDLIREVLAGRKASGDRSTMLSKASWADRTASLLQHLDSVACKCSWTKSCVES